MLVKAAERGPLAVRLLEYRVGGIVTMHREY